MRTYIILGDSERTENDLLYDIAGFFWDAGSEVFIRDKNSEPGYPYPAHTHHCVVLLIPDICFDECLFSTKAVRIYQDLEVDMVQGGQPWLIFSQNGVYSNVIPYPHKLIHFEKLARNELRHFFAWHRSNIWFLNGIFSDAFTGKSS
jgi:hypothetical protein